MHFRFRFPSIVLVVMFFAISGPVRSQQPSADARPVEEGYLTGANDARLFYRVVGVSRDTIVAVHGGPGAGMNAFYPEVKPLAQNHTVIFYDQRGGGRSELPADTTKLHARFFVKDLEAVRRHFGLGRMKIVAHSFGAVLVARYMQKSPTRVERTVFLGATGPKRKEAAKLARSQYAEMDSTIRRRLGKIFGLLKSGKAEDPVALCREYGRLIEGLANKKGEPTNWRGSTCDAPPEAVRYYYRYTAWIAPDTFGDWDFTNNLDHVSAPLLVIYGDRDSLALEQQRAWAEAVPHGRLFVVPDAGKGAIADRPDLVFPALHTFLGGDWPEGAR